MRMSDISCPICTVDDVVDHKDKYECMTCGHEWEKEVVAEDEVVEERVVKDAHGNLTKINYDNA